MLIPIKRKFIKTPPFHHENSFDQLKTQAIKLITFNSVCATASGREEFLRQLQSINEGMKETGAKVEKRYQSDRFSGKFYSSAEH